MNKENNNCDSILKVHKMVNLPPKYKFLEEDEEEVGGSSLDPVFFLRNSEAPSKRKSPCFNRVNTLLIIIMLASLAIMLFRAQNSLEGSISRIKGLIGTLKEEEKEKKEGLSQCHLPMDPGPCRALNTMYYYDGASGSCKEFTYGGCNGNTNRFKSKDLCIATCAQEEGGEKKNVKEEVKNRGIVPELCKPKPEVGPCRSLMTRYYFDVEKLICTTFNYGGCNGNSNNFPTKEECEKVCEHSNPRIVQVDPPEF